VRDHVSHPNKTTGKIMVLYIRIYDDDFFVLHCNLNSILLILCHLWQGSSFCDKFSETQYDTKLYKQKTINIQTDYFLLNSYIHLAFYCWTVSLVQVILHWFSFLELEKGRYQSVPLDRFYCITYS
jgi:hypothetical protein